MCYIKEKKITFLALGASELGVRGWDFTALALGGVLLPAECMLLITHVTKQHLQHWGHFKKCPQISFCIIIKLEL